MVPKLTLLVQNAVAQGRPVVEQRPKGVSDSPPLVHVDLDVTVTRNFRKISE